MSRLFNDASTEYLSRTDLLGISAYPFTFAGWFNIDDTSGTRALISFGGGAGSSGIFMLTLSADGNVKVYVFSGGESIAVSGGSIVQGTWHHAAGVFTSVDPEYRAYLDGTNKGTNSTVRTFQNAVRTDIGRFFNNGADGQYMSGGIGEVGAWNVALTDAEVIVLAAGYSPLFVRPQNLVAYWPLIQGLNDPVGGYTMTASGTVVSAHPRIIRPVMPYYGITIPAVGGIVVLRRRRM